MADLGGGAPGARPPYGPKFPQFHAVFLEIFGKIIGWRPLLREILDPPLVKYVHRILIFNPYRNFKEGGSVVNQERSAKEHEICTAFSGGSRIFQMGGRCFVANGGAHILFSGKKCMKLKEIGLKWGGARLLAPCYSKITIFL